MPTFFTKQRGQMQWSPNCECAKCSKADVTNCQLVISRSRIHPHGKAKGPHPHLHLPLLSSGPRTHHEMFTASNQIHPYVLRKRSNLLLYLTAHVSPPSLSSILLYKYRSLQVLATHWIFFETSTHSRTSPEQMAYISESSSNNWTLSLKLVLISTIVLSLAAMLKLSLPVVSDFVAYEIPSIWSCVLSWLRPPYLYILINFIIISIVASSRLQQKHDDLAADMPVGQPPPTKISGIVADDSVIYGDGVVLSEYGYVEQKVSISEAQVVDTEGVWGRVDQKKPVRDEILANRGDGAGELEREDSLEVLFSSNEREKLPVSAKFAQRKPLKANPEAGKALRVSKPKKHETLENTWKTITEGRSMPLTRHLKKSDTWDSSVRRNQPADENTPPMMKKSETFTDRSANSSLSPSPGLGRLRREPSPSQDELNRRVEAFIKKFNEEMRLQRQESLNQYHDMIRRGTH